MHEFAIPTQTNHGLISHSIRFRVTFRADRRDLDTQEIAIRSLSALTGYSGQLPQIPISLAFGGNNAGGWILSAGAVSAYGTFYSWALNNILQRFIRAKTPHERELYKSFVSRHTKAQLIFWGFVGQIPAAGLTFYYTKNAFYTFVTFACLAPLPILSHFQTYESWKRNRAHTDFEKSLVVTRHQLVSMLRQSQSQLHLFSQEDLLNLAAQLSSNVESNDPSKLLSLLLSKQKKQEGNTHIPGTIGTGIGSVPATIRLWMMFMVSKFATELITDDTYSPSIVGSLVVLSASHLVLTSTTRAASGLTTRLVNFIKGASEPDIAEVINKKLYNTLRTISAISLGLSWAPPVQVADDFFPYNKAATVALQIGLVSAYMFSVTYAQTRIIRDVVLSTHPEDVYSQTLINLTQLYDDVIELIDNSPLIHLADYLTNLSPEQHSEWNIDSGSLSSYIFENRQQLEASSASVSLLDTSGEALDTVV